MLKMKNVLYYFSRTGNSMYAAEEMILKLPNINIILMSCNVSEALALDALVVRVLFPVYQ
jgi:flavodoxin